MLYLKGVYLECGRFVTARSAVLVLNILDVKEHAECGYLICNGDRANHALVSDWETRDLLVLPDRTGSTCTTTVCGPNCMALDRLDRGILPREVTIGDRIVWMNAGAYHIPRETRFSLGIAPVIWCDKVGLLHIARNEEVCSGWWAVWN